MIRYLLIKTQRVIHLIRILIKKKQIIFSLQLRRYDIPWYAAPVHIRKLFIFILQRTIKGYALNIGGVIMVSLESFASVMIFCSYKFE